MKQSGKDPAIVVGKTYDFVLWLLPKVRAFPFLSIHGG
jgi:hypothetical protein